MLENLQSTDFDRLLGQSFRVMLDAQELLQIELIEVTLLGPKPAMGESERRRPFSLLFRDPLGESYLPQQIYQLEHDALGSLGIFLVPLGPHADGVRYEAVFN